MRASKTRSSVSVLSPRRAIVVTSAAAVLAGLFGPACTKPAPEEQMVQKISEDSVKLTDEAIKNIKIEKVLKSDFPDKLSLMGRVSVPEDRTVVVPSRVTGRTDQIFVASGEIVAAGQPLCTIFSADFAVAHEEYIQANKAVQANPEGEDAKHLLMLAKKKLNALGVSESDYDKWKDSEGPKSENLLVRAPRSGALLGKNAVIGSLVNVGDTLFMIGDLRKVWFAGDIYPEDLQKVRKDQEVEIDPGNGQPLLHGKVSFISPAMDPNTRTIKIRVLMDNPNSSLRADMYVQGSIILSKRVALTAPKNAFVRLRDTTFVFKRLPGNIFKKVPVETEGESTDVVAVKTGLNDGDEVVSEGGLLLNAALTSGNGS